MPANLPMPPQQPRQSPFEKNRRSLLLLWLSANLLLVVFFTGDVRAVGILAIVVTLIVLRYNHPIAVRYRAIRQSCSRCQGGGTVWVAGSGYSVPCRHCSTYGR